jgi:hypothetical protein
MNAEDFFEIQCVDLWNQQPRKDLGLNRASCLDDVPQIVR